MNLEPEALLDILIEKRSKAPQGNQAANNDIIATRLQRYRVLLIFYEICEIEPLPEGYPKEITLEFSFLGITQKMKVSTAKTFQLDLPYIAIN